MKRFSIAQWQGTGKEGKGNITTQSPALKNAGYSFKSRFEDGEGTNPEELIAAAHAGCFTMKLSFILGAAGFTPDNLETKCEITLDTAKGAVASSHLSVKGKVKDITKEKFEECVVDAKTNCPISKLLNCEISYDAQLG